jgi:isoleucyl-tRNA synthetase
MESVREVISLGLAQRAEAGIKVRQPLNSASITLPIEITQLAMEEYGHLIAEELNLKEVNLNKGQTTSVSVDVNITKELAAEGVARELIRQVQNARKQAGLNVDDRISLVIDSGVDLINESVKHHAKLIQAETLATHLDEMEENIGEIYETQIKVDNHEVTLRLSKSRN